MLETLIIGGGPAGLAVANTLHKAGIDYLVIEKGAIAQHISQYPTFMQFFSTRDLLEIDGYPLNITDEKPSRRQYLNYLTRFTQDRGLNIRTWCEVLSVEKNSEGNFKILVSKMLHEPEEIHARSVVVACGAYENPRQLGVPGEDLSKVFHHFTEPHPFVGQKVLLVGGRNSAIETALLLWRAGADVSLSYRGAELTGHGIKYWLKPDIENRLKNDEIHNYLGTNVASIQPDTVTLINHTGEKFDIENDFVILELGYDPPVEFLQKMGIELEKDSNKPKQNPDTLETNVTGVFVAGTITAGNVSGNVFIENSRHHGDMILPRLKEILTN